MLDSWPCKSETILLNTVDSETVDNISDSQRTLTWTVIGNK